MLAFFLLEVFPSARGVRSELGAVSWSLCCKTACCKTAMTLSGGGRFP
jgi:hypothetical protein